MLGELHQSARCRSKRVRVGRVACEACHGRPRPAKAIWLAVTYVQLAAKCDIIVENFRPGTLEKRGLGYEELKKLNPGAILVRISAYGQDGPMRTQPGFARIAHAFSGLTYLADYLSGIYDAIGALIALQARQATGEGQCVDLALYESVFRVLDEIAPAYQK
jgi:crotonobetainyl-CoA:carnitine CoA-transferase CaiB-like acyl-CoA transferase